MAVVAAVEMAADYRPPTYVEALLESCTRGLRGRGTCEIGERALDAGTTTVVVIVSWEKAAHLVAHLQVAKRVDSRQEWLTDTRTFSPGDPEIERWRATGFAIATLVDDAVTPTNAPTREHAVRPAPEHAASVVGPAPATRAAPMGNQASLLFDAEFVACTFGDLSDLARGARVGVEWAPWQRSWFFIGAAEYTVQSFDVASIAVTRAQAALGLGLVPARFGERIRLELSALATIDFLRASGVDSATGTQGRGDRWFPGAKLAAALAWTPLESLGFVADLAATAATATDLFGYNQRLVRVPSFGGELGLGIRIVIP